MKLTQASRTGVALAAALHFLTGCSDHNVAERTTPAHSVLSESDDQPRLSPDGSPPYSDDFVMGKDDSGQFLVECKGIRFELTPTAPAGEGFHYSFFGRNFDFMTVGHSVEVRSRLLTVNRQKFGEVAPGDLVTVTQDRTTVRVNGQLRDAMPAQFIVPGGVTFSLAGQRGGLKFSGDGEGFFYDMLGRKCQIREGVFLVDEESYGSVKNGDSVSISWDGTVEVNGTTRVGQNNGSESGVAEE